MEASADFKKTSYSAAKVGTASRRFCDAGKDFQQSGFAGAVAADDAYSLTRLDFKADIVEGPKVLLASGGSPIP
jgi:hypothetical protein